MLRMRHGQLAHARGALRSCGGAQRRRCRSRLICQRRLLIGLGRGRGPAAARGAPAHSPEVRLRSHREIRTPLDAESHPELSGARLPLVAALDKQVRLPNDFNWCCGAVPAMDGATVLPVGRMHGEMCASAPLVYPIRINESNHN